MLSRAQPTLFSEWWWTVDRLLLGALVALVLIGIVLLLAASPPVAIRLGYDPFYFVNRQALYLLPALAVLAATSLLTPRQVRRVALIVFLVSFALVLATLFVGSEIKGARRWISLFGVSLQPSEFLKPAFVVLVAWAFSESTRRP
jgi:cell division protein FtsW